MDEKLAVETEDEDAKAREASFELSDADEEGDEDKEDEARLANSCCCGGGASKVSILGTEQSKLPEP